MSATTHASGCAEDPELTHFRKREISRNLLQADLVAIKESYDLLASFSEHGVVSDEDKKLLYSITLNMTTDTYAVFVSE